MFLFPEMKDNKTLTELCRETTFSSFVQSGILGGGKNQKYLSKIVDKTAKRQRNDG